MKSPPVKIEIKKHLPHQPPMLFVDYITTISTASVATRFHIREDSLFIEKGVFQEMGLIENAAQTCSAIVGQTYFFDEEQQEMEGVIVLGFISSIKKLAVYDLPKVGEEIATSADLISRFDAEGYSVCVMSVQSFVDERKVLEAEINLLLQKQPYEEE